MGIERRIIELERKAARRIVRDKWAEGYAVGVLDMARAAGLVDDQDRCDACIDGAGNYLRHPACASPVHSI